MEELIPHGKGHHAIHVVKYNSDESRWVQRLALTVNNNATEMFQTFFLDEGDFEKTPEELAESIAAIVNKNEN